MKKQPKTMIGAHTSIAGGVFNAISNGEKIDADVVQIFSKSQRQWEGREYTDEELAEFFQLQIETGIKPVVIHNSYLINLANPDPAKREKSIAAFCDEMRRAGILKVPYLLTHPGSHLGSGEAAGVETIAKSLKETWERSAVPDVKILLEATAGQGTNLGNRFEHIRDMLDQSGIASHLGVCIDTCHIFAAGYDMRTAEDWEKTITTFDEIIGLDKLRLFHLNDSAKPFDSRRDRHSRIGQGEIGIEGFRALMNDVRVSHLPMILEVPGGLDGYREDIALLRSLVADRET